MVPGDAIPKSVGRRSVREELVLGALARFTLSSFLRNFSLTAMGASELVSTPPAMPDSIWPSLILLETRIAASRPVLQACWMSYAGVLGDSADPGPTRGEIEVRLC